MNRALLLLICDFLLLSMFALARFDASGPQTAITAQRAAPPSNPPANEEDQELIKLLKQSLEAEAQTRQQLAQQLEASEETIQKQSQELETRKASLEQTQSALEETSEKAKTLAEKRQELEADQAKLLELIREERRASRQFQEQSTEDKESLQQELARQLQESAIIQERLRQAQEQLEKREADLAEAEKRQQQLEATREALEQDKQSLATRLDVTLSEKQLLAQNLEHARQDVETVRQEKQQLHEQTSRLTEEVGQLNVQSTEIRQEIKRSQPKSLNEIFNQYKDNQVMVSFNATVQTVFGKRQRDYTVPTVIVSQEDKPYVLFHVKDTPFDLSGYPGDVLSVDGFVNLGGQRYRLREVAFLRDDPRLMFFPLSPDWLEKQGVHAFPIASEPFQFSQAVLVDSDENNFGETGYKVDPDQEKYLQMDHRIFNKWRGEFSPGEGDLVFAKSGEFLGIMANKTYSFMVNDFSFDERVALGDQFIPERNKIVLQRLRGYIADLPADKQ